MIYLLCWTFHLATVWVLPTRQSFKLITFISFIAFSLVACLRGKVGPDTVNYSIIIQLLNWNSLDRSPVEPLFAILCLLLRDILFFDEYVVNALSMFFSLSLLLLYSSSSSNLKSVYLLYSLPVFFFPFSMNIIRCGLAVSLFMCGWVKLLNNKPERDRLERVKAFGLMIIGGLFHVSTIYLLFLLFLSTFRYLKKKDFILLGALSVFLIFSNLAHILKKKSVYLESHFPSVVVDYSELSFFKDMISGRPARGRLIMGALILVGIIFSGLSKSKRKELVLIGLLNLIFIEFLICYGSFGVRFLEIFLFSFPLIIAFSFDFEGIAISKSHKKTLIVFSIMMLVFVFKDFYLSKYSSRSPYLPYKIFSSNG